MRENRKNSKATENEYLEEVVSEKFLSMYVDMIQEAHAVGDKEENNK